MFKISLRRIAAVFCFFVLPAVFAVSVFSVFVFSMPGFSVSAEGREITDMSGRRVSVPDTITKVYGASPPATYMIYAIDPALIAGLNYPFNSKEHRYLNPGMETLPVIGGWFGQGRAPNQENLLHVKPDVMIVWMWKESAVNEKIEQTAQQLGLPLVYIRIDHLSDYAKAFLFMGKLLHREERGRMLSDYAAATIKAIEPVISAIPDGKKISVYYAEGMDGLSTECDQSVHAELINLAGGKNIYRCDLKDGSKDGYGMKRITIEQIMLNNPQVIIAQEKSFADHVLDDPRWQSIRAVKNKRVYAIPRFPFNWFDRPPSFMRLLGIKWLTHILYQDRYPLNLTGETKAFYKLFLGIEPDDSALKEVLQR